MININFYKNQMIELIKTDLPNTYTNFYVDEKFNSKLSFTFYKQIHLDELLNAKTISLEYVKVRNLWTNLA